MAKKLIRITDKDNVAVALSPIVKGDVLNIDNLTITATMDITAGHKISLFDIKKGEPVIKYGYPIGYAKEDIPVGSAVHTFNVKTGLSEGAEYSYDEEAAKECVLEMEANKREYTDEKVPRINAYERKNGKIGIRNALWIVPTVGCVNQISKKLEQWGNENLGLEDGVHAWIHPFGCSQMGGDHENTRVILADLVNHPNAGGVLVIGLGCENNTMPEFKALCGDVDPQRVKFMVSQDYEDELEEAKKLLKEIAEVMKKDRRTSVPMSRRWLLWHYGKPTRRQVH